MSGPEVAAALVVALAVVAGAGFAWDRVRGRREPAGRDPGATGRYYRDGGDATFGYDQGSGGGVP